MVAINMKYQGDMRCLAVHGLSGTTLVTDAPKDNIGKAESFSPTVLVATALGTCILTVMGIKAHSIDMDIIGSTASVEKEMAAGTRRIGKLAVTVHIPHRLPERQTQQLEQAASTCPVHKSMSRQVEMPIDFIWGYPLRHPAATGMSR